MNNITSIQGRRLVDLYWPRKNDKTGPTNL